MKKRTGCVGGCLALFVILFVIGIIGGAINQSSGPSNSPDKQQPGEASTAQPDPNEPMVESPIKSLPRISVRTHDGLLRVVNMTDKLDAIYKQHGTSSDFITAARPIELAMLKAQNLLPKKDPRRDLLVNMFEAYQNTALLMVGIEKGVEKATRETTDATFVTAGLRKTLLSKLLSGDMSDDEKELYYTWRRGIDQQQP